MGSILNFNILDSNISILPARTLRFHLHGRLPDGHQRHCCCHLIHRVHFSLQKLFGLQLRVILNRRTNAAITVQEIILTAAVT